MTTYIRDVIAMLQRDGISFGWGSPKENEPKCMMHALAKAVNKSGFGFTNRNTAEYQDCKAIRAVILEQYPEQPGSPGLFNDSMAQQGRYKEIFTVLEKAYVKRLEEL